MWSFYWHLLKDTPEAFRGAWELVFWLAAIGLVALTLFNERLGKSVSEQWNGISPWWTFATVAPFFVARMAQNNYERFTALQQRVVTDEQRREQRNEIRRRLTRLMSEHDFYCECCRVRSEPEGLGVQVKALDVKTQLFLSDGLGGDDSFVDLYVFAMANSYELTPAEAEYFRPNPGGNYLEWYRILRARRLVLERVWNQFPSL